MIQETDFKSLYGSTGDIKDFNTLLVNRNVLRDLMKNQKANGQPSHPNCCQACFPQACSCFFFLD